MQRNFIVPFNTKKKMNESLTQTTVKNETGQDSPAQTVDFTDPLSYFQAEKSLAGKWEREKKKIKFFKVKYTQQKFHIYAWVFHFFSCSSITLFSSAQVSVWLDSFFCQSSVIFQNIFRSPYSRFQEKDHRDSMYYLIIHGVKESEHTTFP